MNKCIYNISVIFCFFAIALLAGLYFNCFCLYGDDIMLIPASLERFWWADHANFIHDKLHLLLNYLLPKIFNINPQVFLQNFNCYVYGIIYAILSYLLTKSAFLFNKKKLFFPILMFMVSVSLFIILINITANYGNYWLRESCTFLRYSLAMLFAFLMLNNFIRCVFLNKNIKLKRSIFFTTIILGVLCTNASEYNAFTYILAVSFILLLVIFSKTKFKKNALKNFIKSKTFKILLTALSGLILGMLLIVINPAFITVQWDCRASLLFENKEFISLFHFLKNTLIYPNLILIGLFIIFAPIIKKQYKKAIYNNIFIVSLSLLFAQNLFYVFFYCIIKDTNELFHGDILTLYLGTLIYNILFFVGFVIRKIKNKKIYITVLTIAVLIFSIFVHGHWNTTDRIIKDIRIYNIGHRAYLKNLENDFLEQYYNGNHNIILQLDYYENQFYNDNYILRFVPLYHKKRNAENDSDDKYELIWKSKTEFTDKGY